MRRILLILAIGVSISALALGQAGTSAPEGLARTGPLIPDWLRWTLGGAAVAAGGAGLWAFLRRRHPPRT